MKKEKEKEKITGEERKQRRLFKKKRAGVVLTREQVKEIKDGRKKLRKDMKAAGVKSKKEFELTASSLGLYFDKRNLGALFWWLHGRGLWALLGALSVLMLATFVFSWLGQLRGHFTINLSDGMFREGFSISETEDFRNPTTNLIANPAMDVPCISIRQIPDDIDNYEGEHNEKYFAYTYFVRNEGERDTAYSWTVSLNAESKKLSTAAWVMIFEDGAMTFYAKSNSNGDSEALPPKTDNSRGYSKIPTLEFLKNPNEQIEEIVTKNGTTYYRVIPQPFESDNVIASGLVRQVKPMDIHKYTVVIWLEGDDPDCTDELIGGHIGLEMNLQLVEEDDGEETSRTWWREIWDNLKWWEE